VLVEVTEEEEVKGSRWRRRRRLISGASWPGGRWPGRELLKHGLRAQPKSTSAGTTTNPPRHSLSCSQLLLLLLLRPQRSSPSCHLVLPHARRAPPRAPAQGQPRPAAHRPVGAIRTTPARPPSSTRSPRSTARSRPSSRLTFGHSSGLTGAHSGTRSLPSPTRLSAQNCSSRSAM
jgi:hypothetical protein